VVGAAPHLEKNGGNSTAPGKEWWEQHRTWERMGEAAPRLEKNGGSGTAPGKEWWERRLAAMGFKKEK
jgi:hypothetical protein